MWNYEFKTYDNKFSIWLMNKDINEDNIDKWKIILIKRKNFEIKWKEKRKVQLKMITIYQLNYLEMKIYKLIKFLNYYKVKYL